MCVTVIKRDGTKVLFDKLKIQRAILNAYKEYYNNENCNYAEEIASIIEEAVSSSEIEEITVEDIQDMVEDNLMEYDKIIARTYIKYRYKHGMIRSCSADFVRLISEKLKATDVQNQNANVDENSFGGRIGEATNEMMKQYALDYCMSEKSKNNHLNNRIYIHDLSHYAVGDHNCLSIPFDDLLAKGFNTRQTDIRPANSINTAFQLLAVIFQLQSLQQFGGVSATHLDWTMVPYVRKSFYKHYLDGMKYIGGLNEKEIADNLKYNYSFEPKEKAITDEIYQQHQNEYKYAMSMTERELQQAVEGMFHNLNTLQSRSGNQLN